MGTMMWSSNIIGVLLFSGSVGLTAYGLTCAFHVWHVRHAGKEKDASGWSLGRISGLLLAGGIVCVLAGGVVRLVSQREGVLVGEGLYSVTLPQKGLQVKQVTPVTFVEPGAVLVRFCAAEREVGPHPAEPARSLASKPEA